MPGRCGLLDPLHQARLLVQRHQPSVQKPCEHMVFINREPPVHIPATDARPPVPLVGNSGVPLPYFLSSAGIESEDEAVRSRCVHHTVRNQRRRFEPRSGFGDLPTPGEPQPVDVVGVDLIERAVVRFSLVSTVGQPFLRSRLLQRQGSRAVGLLGGRRLPSEGPERHDNTRESAEYGDNQPPIVRRPIFSKWTLHHGMAPFGDL